MEDPYIPGIFALGGAAIAGLFSLVVTVVNNRHRLRELQLRIEAEAQQQEKDRLIRLSESERATELAEWQQKRADASQMLSRLYQTLFLLADFHFHPDNQKLAEIKLRWAEASQLMLTFAGDVWSPELNQEVYETTKLVDVAVTQADFWGPSGPRRDLARDMYEEAKQSSVELSRAVQSELLRRRPSHASAVVPGSATERPINLT
ncbi:MAG: hypothetical protein M3N53_03445 [Actinomycetota bacterium]|nr:hypothetical protein [Actinomycetota bacterium]